MKKWALGAALLLSQPAWGFRVDLPLDALCAVAPVVVVAEVTDVASYWAPGARGELETWVEIHVETVAKGHFPEGAPVIVPGGRIGDLALLVEDAAVLRPDHRYLLLLTSREDGAFVVTGGEAGARELTPQTPSAAQWLAVLPECSDG